MIELLIGTRADVYAWLTDWFRLGKIRHCYDGRLESLSSSVLGRIICYYLERFWSLYHTHHYKNYLLLPFRVQSLGQYFSKFLHWYTIQWWSQKCKISFVKGQRCTFYQNLVEFKVSQWKLRQFRGNLVFIKYYVNA